MKRLYTLLSAFSVCIGTLWGTIEEWQAFVTSTSSGASSVVPIDLSTYTEGTVIGVDDGPIAIAITPDGRRTLVVNSGSKDVSVIDLTASPATSYAIPLGTIGYPTNIAISPDGTKALVSCFPGVNGAPAGEYNGTAIVAIVDLTVSPVAVVSTVQLFGGDALAITPDGKRALVGFSFRQKERFSALLASVGVIDLTTTPTSISNTAIPVVCDGGIAVTPDGTRALIVTQDSNSVTMVDLTATPTPQQLHGVTVGSSPNDVAITPDGKRALVTYTGDDGGVTVLDLEETTLTVETLSVPLGLTPTAISITPDGKRAVIAGDSETSNKMVFLDLTTSPVSILPTSPLDIEGATDVAITPDQAPTAQFTYSLKHKRDDKRTVLFDGSTSTSPVGSIAKYEWNFGDGHTAVTTSSKVSHTYHHPREGKHYHVRLTVTNTGGTSTSVVFTGRTVSNNGGSSATVARRLVVRY